MAAVVDSSTALPDIEMKEIDVEEGVAKSFEQALADVATKNPDLYSQYLSEKGA